MYNCLFHLKMALSYLKYAKNIPEKYRNELYKEIESIYQKAQKLKEEWK